MARNLDLASLRSFVVVAESGGVTKAAQQLHLTQSGVSMQLKRLEEALQIELLTREGRGVALTKLGEELLSSARKLISLNDEVWEKLTTPPYEGALTLGMPHDIVYPFAPAILKRFNEDHPEIKLSLVSPPSKELIALHDAGKADVIVTTEFDCGANGRTLAHEDLVWVGAPGGVAWRRNPVPIAFDRRCIFRKPTFAAMDAIGVTWDWRIETANCAAETASVAADLAITTLLRGFIPAPLVAIDHCGELPPLPRAKINIYVSAGPNEQNAVELSQYVEDAIKALRPDDVAGLAWKRQTKGVTQICG